MNNKLGIILSLLVFAGMFYTVYSYFFVEDVVVASTIERLDGEEPINLDEFLGQKKTILQFVAVPCECCADSMPAVKQFIEKQDDIELITIVFSGREREILDKFENEYEVTHLWGVDLDRDLAYEYEVKWSPNYIFYDEKGNFLGSHPYIIATTEELEKHYEDAYEAYHGEGTS